MRTNYHTLLDSQGNPKELDFEQYNKFWDISSCDYRPPVKHKWHYSTLTSEYMWLPEDK